MIKNKKIYKFIISLLIFCFVISPQSLGHLFHHHHENCSHFSLPFQSFAHASIFEDMTIYEEQQLGEKYNAIMKTKAPLVYDPFVQDYLQDMVGNILQNAPAQPFVYEVNLMLDTSLNAFASPGGLLFVNSGLFLAMENESELASVVSHEVAHVTQRHIASRQGKSAATMLASFAAALAAAIVGTTVEGAEASAQAALAGGMAIAQTALLSYSRSDETEADNVGFEYHIKAGYDPYSYPEAFRKLQNQFGFGGSIPTYLSTHPDLNARISGIDARITAQKAIKVQDNNKRFLAVQNFIRAKYSDIESALLYFAKKDQEDPFIIFSKALLYARKHDVNNAKASFDKALKLAPNNWLFLREAAYFQYQYGSIEHAYDLIEKSYKAQPNDLMTHFYRGRILEDLGRTSSARLEYDIILEKYPFDSQVHKHIAHTYGKTGDQLKAYIHLAYSELYKGNFKKARNYANTSKTFTKTQNEKDILKKYERDYDFYFSVVNDT